MDELDLSGVRYCACGNVRRAARAISRRYDEALQPAGLKATQFALLATIGRHGSLTVTHLADAQSMDYSTLSRNLRPLEERGLVVSSTGDDQRTRCAELTPKGIAILKDALPLWREVQDQTTARLGLERFVWLLQDLTELTKPLP